MSPGTSLDEHLQLADLTIEMLRLAREAFQKQRRDLVASLLRLGHDVHQREKLLTAGLSPAGLDVERIFVPIHFERIGDNIESFAHAIERLMAEAVPFTDRATREITTLLDKAIELLQATRDVIRTGNAVLVRHVLTEGPAFEAMATDFARFHEERLIQGLCRPKASSIYLAMIDYLRGVERHQREIVQKMTAHSQTETVGGRSSTSMLT